MFSHSAVQMKINHCAVPDSFMFAVVIRTRKSNKRKMQLKLSTVYILGFIAKAKVEQANLRFVAPKTSGVQSLYGCRRCGVDLIY